ncbi:Thyrotropin-releasing hormone-degrading ectoenzyme [Aphelenchoides bicaudatus]|nr:Thyrotropin-releasing hormone-degrading ectoenzyme [Aphelenchoides bicaudatus]
MFSVYPSRTDSTANWTIPIFAYNLRTGEESVGYLLEDGKTCPENWVNASDSYIFNHKSSTFARVTYSETLWEQFLKMDTTKIDDTTLLGLITDAMDFENEQYAIANWRSTKLFKKIVADSKGKVSPHIVEAILRRFLSVRNFFSAGDGLDLYSHLLQSHFTSIYNQLDWASSDWAAGHTNYLLLPAAVKFNIGDARKKAKELFKQFTVDCAAFKNFETCNKIQADARTASYCAGAIDNDQDSVTFLTNYWHEMIRNRKTFFYFQYEMEAACITDQNQLKDLLETAVYENETNFINALEFNAEASSVLYEFITNNVTLFNRHLQMLSNALSSMISTWSSDKDMDNLLTLIASIQDKLPGDAKQIFSDAILALGNNIKRGKQVIPQITFTTTKATQQIQINSHRQLINFIQVSTSSGLVNAKTSRDYDNGILTLDLESLVAAKSRVMIEIGFIGLIFDKLVDSTQGVNFYESYNTKTDELSSILYTELAGGANPRSLVPCFDEPKYKATWDITVRHPSVFTALSNGVILSHELDSLGYSTTKFSQTKPMSTYIVAIAIGKFGSLSGVTPDGIPVRVWARLGYELYAKVALEAAINTINYLSQEMKESYKQFGSKLDILAAPLYAGELIAVPEDPSSSVSKMSFKIANMLVIVSYGELASKQALGFIIGKEEYVLHNSEVQTLENKQNVYRVMAHETTHHWFGDLVTTKDWYNTFVNEGFATFFESEIFGHYFGHDEKFRFTSSESALRYDEKVQARIIPSDVNVYGFEPFSPIVYEKESLCFQNNNPSSVMQMLRSFVGDDVFKTGLQNYIAARAFRNADDATLWSYITQAAQAKQITGWDGELLDVQRFMDPFFKQVSYPVLSVYTPENTGLVNVKQTSYYDPAKLPKSDFDYRWFIPITWVYDAKNNRTDWVYNEVFEQIPFKSAAWLTLGRTTYARVKYDDKVWSEVLKNLVNNTRYNDTVWASIVTDNWALANSGQVKWDRLLETLQHLKYTNGELAWRYGFEVFDNLISRLKTTPAFGKLKKLIADAINDRGNYGGNGNSFISKLAARLQIGKFVDVAKSFMDHGGSDCVSSPYGIHQCLNVFISPDNRAQFLCSGIQTYKNLKTKMEAVLDNLNEKNNAFLPASVDPLIEMVSCLQDEKETQKYLAFSVEGYYYGFSDLFIQRLAHLDMTNTYLYNWLMSKSDTFTNLGLLHQSEQFSTFVQAMTNDWATSELLNKFNAIKWEVLNDKRASAVKNAANNIRSNIQWQSDNYDSIFQWLNKNY